MTLRRRLMALLVAAFLATCGVLAPLPTTPAQAASCSGVWVVVETSVRCSTSYSTINTHNNWLRQFFKSRRNFIYLLSNTNQRLYIIYSNRFLHLIKVTTRYTSTARVLTNRMKRPVGP